MPNYEVFDVLGEGSFGIVYAARNTITRQQRALKRVRGKANPRAIQEAKALTRIQHTNVVDAYEAFEHEGEVYIVMELVEGVDLTHFLSDTDKPLPPEIALAIARDVARGLSAAHAAGVIHRDIKPANIMISASGCARILDFGLAMLCESGELRITSDSKMLGTLAYISPEQINHPRNVDKRSDFFSLGCVLYELLTGQIPFDGDSRKVQTALRLQGKARKLPDELSFLQSLMDRLLARNPDDRFRSADELIVSIQEFLNSGEVEISSRIKECVQTKLVSSRSLKSDLPVERNKEKNAGKTTSVSRRRAIALWGVAGGASFLGAAALFLWYTFRGKVARTMENTPVAQEILALPGLNGLWVMDEVPWLLPHIRDNIARTLLASDKAVAIDICSCRTDDVYNSISQLSTEARGLSISFGNGAIRELLSKEFPKLVAELIGRCSPPSAPAAVYIHSIANLLHLQARSDEPTTLTDNDLSLFSFKSQAETPIQRTWNAAISAYAYALELYRASATEMVPNGNSRLLLTILARSDYARLCLDLTGKIGVSVGDATLGTAALNLNEAISLLGIPLDINEPVNFRRVAHPELAVSLACASAEVERKRRRWQEVDRWISVAKRLLPSAADSMTAYVEERMAWSHLDLVYENAPLTDAVALTGEHGPSAARLFDSARIRRKRHVVTTHNRHAQTLYFHAWHGKAYSMRFRRDGQSFTEAYKEFESICDEVRIALKTSVDDEKLGLTNRLFNTIERRADCKLFDSQCPEAEVEDELLLALKEIEDVSPYSLVNQETELTELDQAISLCLKLYLILPSVATAQHEDGDKHRWVQNARRLIRHHITLSADIKELSPQRHWRELLMDFAALKFRVAEEPMSVVADCARLDATLRKTFGVAGEDVPCRDERDILLLAKRSLSSVHPSQEFLPAIRSVQAMCDKLGNA